MKHAVVVAVAAVLCLPAAAQDRQERRERREERREAARENRADDRALDPPKNEAKKKKTAAPSTNRRQRRQASRLVGGVRAGQLTADEVSALAGHEAALRALEADARADGSLRPAERAQLQRELAALSKEMHAEKHDDDVGLAVKAGHAEDRAAAASARRLAEVRRALNTTTPTPEQRAALDAEHAALVDDLFEDAGDGAL